MKEIWRTCWYNDTEFSDYQVSNLGRVKSLKHSKERIMKPYKNTTGYLIIDLRKNNKRTPCCIHVLVANSFLYNIGNYYNEVDHIDTDLTNNKTTNLRFCNHSQNCNNPNTLRKRSKPVYCITNDTVYKSTREAERSLGVSSGNISHCCRGTCNSIGGYKFKYYEGE